MPSNNESNRQQFFKHVNPGDPVSSSEWNKLTKEVSRGTAQPNKHPKHPTRAIKLMKLTEVIGQFGAGDSSEAHRRGGVVQYYDEVLDDFVPTSNTETKGNITDGLRLIYDAEEYVWCVYLEQSGHWHPLNPRTIRHAVTVSDASGYTACGGRVYPIKFVKISYTKSITATPSAPTKLDTSDTDPDDYVLNLFEGSDENPVPHIPLGTTIWCYNVLQQWYTYIDLPCLESSSSDSSSSSSKSSSSTSSFSSQSGVSSSSSSSVGFSSSTSLSSGGSSSSDSTVSASSSVPGYDCTEYVSSVEFNSETCLLTVVTRWLWWPEGLGILTAETSC